MSPETWKSCWALLEAVYPNAKQAGNPDSCEAYATLLGQYWDHEVKQAVKEAVAGARWFPTPAELLDRLGRHRKLLGNDWDTVEAKLKLEAQGRPVPAALPEGPDRTHELLDRVAPDWRKIGTDR